MVANGVNALARGPRGGNKNQIPKIKASLKTPKRNILDQMGDGSRALLPNLGTRQKVGNYPTQSLNVLL